MRDILLKALALALFMMLTAWFVMLLMPLITQGVYTTGYVQTFSAIVALRLTYVIISFHYDKED